MRKINEERFLQIGLNIAYYRKLRKLTQIQLAEEVSISRTFLSNIEAPNVAVSASVETLFDIADALGIEPKQLFEFRENAVSSI